jgi:hypothetical protein
LIVCCRFVNWWHDIPINFVIVEAALVQICTIALLKVQQQIHVLENLHFKYRRN